MSKSRLDGYFSVRFLVLFALVIWAAPGFGPGFGMMNDSSPPKRPPPLAPVRAVRDNIDRRDPPRPVNLTRADQPKGIAPTQSGFSAVHPSMSTMEEVEAIDFSNSSPRFPHTGGFCTPIEPECVVAKNEFSSVNQTNHLLGAVVHEVDPNLSTQTRENEMLDPIIESRVHEVLRFCSSSDTEYLCKRIKQKQGSLTDNIYSLFDQFFSKASPPLPTEQEFKAVLGRESLKFDKQSDKRSDKDKAISDVLALRSRELNALYREMLIEKEKYEKIVMDSVLKQNTATDEKVLGQISDQAFEAYRRATEKYNEQIKIARVTPTNPPEVQKLLNTKRFLKRVQGESPLPVGDFRPLDLGLMRQEIFRKAIADLGDIALREHGRLSSDEVERKNPLLAAQFSCGNQPLSPAAKDLYGMGLREPAKLLKDEVLLRAGLDALIAGSPQLKGTEGGEKIRGYIRTGQYQRAVWEGAKHDPQAAATMEGLLRVGLINQVEKGKCKFEGLNSGASLTTVARCENGLQAIFKPDSNSVFGFMVTREGGGNISRADIDNPHGEFMTHLIDRELGWNTVPLTIRMKPPGHERGTLQLWVHHASDANDHVEGIWKDRSENLNDHSQRPVTSDILHGIIGNKDNHNANILHFNDSWDSHVIHIDNAKAFSIDSMKTATFQRHLDAVRNSLRDRPLNKQAIAGLKVDLERAKAKINEFGKEDPFRRKHFFSDNPDYDLCHAELAKVRIDCFIELLGKSEKDLKKDFICKKYSKITQGNNFALWDEAQQKGDTSVRLVPPKVCEMKYK